ncbi:MAG: pacearchaeosortase [Nanoarchaeota archaeon]|nr:pacearchaeosortase [Nanoarchaeota archaeon]MBU1104131.1 pacearchaeosortase [Nanoarchaeota archaeon]
MKNKEGLALLGRYVLLILLGFSKLKLFYLVFTPLTVYPVFWFLSAFYSNASLLVANLIFFGGIYVQIIPACVAGAAFYLLFILNLTTPMKAGKRIKSLIFLVIAFLFLNITRILIFSSLAITGSDYFDIAHELTWYFGSTLIVVLIWFVNVWLFRIKTIPVYTDMKNVYREIVSGRK